MTSSVIFKMMILSSRICPQVAAPTLCWTSTRPPPDPANKPSFFTPSATKPVNKTHPSLISSNPSLSPRLRIKFSINRSLSTIIAETGTILKLEAGMIQRLVRISLFPRRSMMKSRMLRIVNRCWQRSRKSVTLTDIKMALLRNETHRWRFSESHTRIKLSWLLQFRNMALIQDRPVTFPPCTRCKGPRPKTPQLRSKMKKTRLTSNSPN